MRIQVVKGDATGEGQRKLPRAYGMMKVFWDSELAAFAKMMISQCLAKHKYSCAASKNFTNPTMTYSFANTTSSATEIIDNIFMSWQAAALATTPDDILHSPDLKGGKSRFYLKMVVGAVTHVGCAIGAYKHEIRDGNNIKLSGHLICYMSHYSRAGTPVYNTTAPGHGIGLTKCGCPPKYRDTKDCLCVPTLSTASTTAKPQTKKEMEIITLPHLKELMAKQQRASENEPFELIKQQDLDRELQEMLEPTKQKKLEWTPQQKKRTQSTPKQRTEVATPAPPASSASPSPAPTCITGNCAPKIVMMPIFTIQDVPQDFNSNKGVGPHRRFGNSNTSSVQLAMAMDDFGLPDEKDDELPKKMSLRSKLLQTVSRIRKNESTNFFSYEENIEPDSKVLERSERILEPFKRIMEHSSIPEFSSPVRGTTESHDDRTFNNAKKRVMKLLDLLEEKGRKAQLSSREIIEFDAKMRRIYKSVLGTRGDKQL